MQAACFAAPLAPARLPCRRPPSSTSLRAPVRAQHSFDRAPSPGVPDTPTPPPGVQAPSSPASASAFAAGGSIPGGPPSAPWPGGSGGSGGGNDDGPPADLSASVSAAVRSGRVSPADAARLLALSSGRLRLLCALLPGVRDRLAANPLFLTQLAVELTVGCTAKWMAEVRERGARMRAEAALVASDMALEIATDVALVYLLSPRVRLAGGGKGGFLAGCPSHAGQVGAFSTAQRAAGFAVRGAQFGAIAFASAVVGHAVTKMLVERGRGAVEGEGGDEGKMAGVGATAAVWGAFVMTSSNARYQIVNGVEQRFVGPLLQGAPLLRTGVTFALRFSNCMVGSMQWIPWARYWGVQ